MLSVALATLALCALSAPARADFPDKGLYLGVQTGGDFALRDWNLGSNAFQAQDGSKGGLRPGGYGMWGMRLGFQMIQHLALEAEFAWLPLPTDRLGLSHALTFDLNVVYNILGGDWTPILEAGFGGYAVVAGNLGNDVDPRFHLGIGVRGKINEWAALRVEIRDVFTNGFDSLGGNNLELLAGVEFFLWSNAKKVYTCTEACGSTPAPVIVQASRCEPVPCEQPKIVEAPKPTPPAENEVLIAEAAKLARLESVQFETNKDKILAKSFSLLQTVAESLRSHPEFKKVTIEGYTDNKGSPEANADLSQRRAKSIQAWLVAHGIEADRLEAHGYGQANPVADNGTVEGRARNRRTEFHVVDPPMAADLRTRSEAPTKSEPVRIVGNKLTLAEPVQFLASTAKLLSKSVNILSSVADTLRTHPEIKKLVIEGYTDNAGSLSEATALSDDRAMSVLNWLTGHGVDPGRLEVRGYGPANPVADNATKAGRALNNRIEFRIGDAGAAPKR